MTAGPMIRSVTFDTNVFPTDGLAAQARALGLEVAVISVSAREAEGSSVEDEIRSLEQVLETGVWGESRWGQAQLGDRSDAERLESILALLSNGAFPATGAREQLTHGQRRQLRDAMILAAHIRSGRDLLVTNDARAFVAAGRRAAISESFGTATMTVKEFEAFLRNLTPPAG